MAQFLLCATCLMVGVGLKAILDAHRALNGSGSGGAAEHAIGSVLFGGGGGGGSGGSFGGRLAAVDEAVGGASSSTGGGGHGETGHAAAGTPQAWAWVLCLSYSVSLHLLFLIRAAHYLNAPVIRDSRRDCSSYPSLCTWPPPSRGIVF